MPFVHSDNYKGDNFERRLIVKHYVRRVQEKNIIRKESQNEDFDLDDLDCGEK